METRFDFRGRITRVMKAYAFFGVMKNKKGAFKFVPFALMTVVLNLLILSEIAYLRFAVSHSNSRTPAMLFIQILTASFTNIKIYYLLKFRKNILHLRDTVNRNSFQPKNQRQLEMTKDTFWVLDVTYTAYRIFPVMAIGLFGLYPLINEPEKRKLPFFTRYPFDHTKIHFYVLAVIHQMMGQMFAGQISIHGDTLNFSLMAVVVTQMDILCDDLKNLFQSSAKVSMLDCIKHHKEILKFCEEVNDIQNVNVFWQFVLTTGGLCLALLQFSSIQSRFEILEMVLFVVSFLIELFMYCWWGEQIIVKSENLSLAAFQSSWSQASPKLKKDVMFLIHRTQIPHVVYAIDFFKLNLQSFLSILRLSYSYYTVIRKVNTK